MSAATLEGLRPSDPVERLLEDSWHARSKSASARERTVEGLAALAFLCCAGPLAIHALGAHDVDPLLAASMVGMYAFVARLIKFPIGAGYVVPSYLVLVPMLLLLPPGLVPLLTAGGLLLGTLIKSLARRAERERVLMSIPDAWHALGPAVVLVAAGPVHGGVHAALVYAAAFAAGCMVDLTSATVREAAIQGLRSHLQLRVIALVWLVDAALAPLGLLVAHAAVHERADLLLILPVNGLLLALSRERNARIAQAHRRLEALLTDPLTKLGNRRKLSADLEARFAKASTSAPLVLALFDLDGFKGYNDTFGHLAGDALLARLGVKLKAAVEEHGSAYRLGGDEFCVLLSAPAQELGRGLAAAVDALKESGERFAVGASYGAVALPAEAANLEHAIQLADERMYERKRGRPSNRGEEVREVLGSIIHANRPALEAHSSEVGRLCLRVGIRLGLTGEALLELEHAGALHDIGKVGIPDTILAKVTPLSEAESEYVRRHTLLGERMLAAIPALRGVAALVRSSHERWDGGGYPDGLAGEQIPLGSRVIAACDAYEAMRSERPYRARLGHGAACEELRRASGLQFDPDVVQALLTELAEAGEAPAAESAAASTEHRRQQRCTLAHRTDPCAQHGPREECTVGAQN
ncbi:MAG: diguanylate cyclase [Actinobacteria bacterium]|nr:MAG: diguanylate cyclase [Actinomycetota bacterium]